MTAKELINKLQKCDPDSIVCVEAYSDALACEVQEYLADDGVRYVYIADDLEYIDEDFRGSRVDYPAHEYTQMA